MMATQLAPTSYEVGLQRVPIDQIVVALPTRRHLNEAKVAAYADSIAQIGLIHPISVTRSLMLGPGWHRLEACRRLGHTHIDAMVRDWNDLELEACILSENLLRNDLDILEQAEHIDRLEQLLLELGQRATDRDGAALRDSRRLTGSSDKLSGGPTTTRDIGAQFGFDARTVQRRVKIARALPANVRDALRETPIANREGDLRYLAAMFLSQGSERLEADTVVDDIVSSHRKTLSEALTAVRGEARHAPGVYADEDEYDGPGDDVPERLYPVRVELVVYLRTPNLKDRARGLKEAQRESIEKEHHVDIPPFDIAVRERGREGKIEVAKALANAFLADRRIDADWGNLP